MAQDAEGIVLMAHSTLGTVFVHSANGELALKIKSHRGVHMTNGTWGGPLMNVLYIVKSEGHYNRNQCRGSTGLAKN